MIRYDQQGALCENCSTCNFKKKKKKVVQQRRSKHTTPVMYGLISIYQQIFNTYEHKQTGALLKNIPDSFPSCEIIAEGCTRVCVCEWGSRLTARFSSTGSACWLSGWLHRCELCSSPPEREEVMREKMTILRPLSSPSHKRSLGFTS